MPSDGNDVRAIHARKLGIDFRLRLHLAEKAFNSPVVIMERLAHGGREPLHQRIRILRVEGDPEPQVDVLQALEALHASWPAREKLPRLAGLSHHQEAGLQPPALSIAVAIAKWQP